MRLMFGIRGGGQGYGLMARVQRAVLFTAYLGINRCHVPGIINPLSVASFGDPAKL
jgi:hypothetical protein